MTPTSLFQQGLRQVGVLGRGQNVSPEQLTDALNLCNMMLGQWARKRWLVFHLLELYVTGNGGGSYLLGPPGNSDFTIHWDDPKLTWDASGLTFDQSFQTNRIEKAFVRLNAGQAGQVDIPLAIVRAAEDWSTIPVKNIVAGLPQMVFLDSGYPVATLEVWPAPSSQYQIHILILNPLVRFDISSLTLDINLPDEYQDALFWNLCRRLMNSYRKPIDPEINIQAAAALNTVKNANFQLSQLRMPADLTRSGSYNIYTDQPR
jgi:hypothetical protein